MGERAVEASAPRMSWADIALATAMRSVSGRELIVSITRDERITGLFMTEEIFKLLVFCLRGKVRTVHGHEYGISTLMNVKMCSFR